MGIKITDVKIVGICSKHRKKDDKIPRYKDGTIVPDKNIACLADVFGDGGVKKGRKEINMAIRIEIAKVTFNDKWNMRIGDLTGSAESSNFTKEEILEEISDEMDSESKKDKQ